MSEYYGHKTLKDGSHIPLSQEEAEALWHAARSGKASRAQNMPDQDSALSAMFDAWQRLKELGWRDAIYCPKDGSEFEVIEAGSTGVHRCLYQGEWPSGSWLISGDGDLWPSRPILFRLLPEAQADYDAKMKEAFKLSEKMCLEEQQPQDRK